MKFLVVEDDGGTLSAKLSALLQRDGLEILTARSAAEAHELVRAHDIALAFVDMPEIELPIPVVFVTASGQRRQIEETRRVAETLMAAVGHDLRNPLTSMLMASTLIASKSQDPSITSLALRIKASGQRMESIIDDLFEMGTGLELSVFPMDLAAVVARVTGELDATKEKIKITTEGDLHATWDPSRIGRTLTNLLGNALTHGSGGVELAIRAIGDGIVITVHNEGVIPADVLPNIFDPFRARRARARRGLGLGLVIVHQIVLAHGGTITVASTTESGTTFTITLPRTPPARNTPATTVASASSS